MTRLAVGAGGVVVGGLALTLPAARCNGNLYSRHATCVLFCLGVQACSVFVLIATTAAQPRNVRPQP